MIDTLNKALKALNATDLDYGGHREKAINHVEAAIHKLQVPPPTPRRRATGRRRQGFRQGRHRQRFRQDRDDSSGRI